MGVRLVQVLGWPKETGSFLPPKTVDEYTFDLPLETVGEGNFPLPAQTVDECTFDLPLETVGEDGA